MNKKRKMSCLCITVIIITFSFGWAHALPLAFLPASWSDVDKVHTGTDAIGGFTGIDANHTNRCWQASFANMLFTLGLTINPYQTYLDNFSIWGNSGTTALQQDALFDTYFTTRNLQYYATAYTNLNSVNFLFAQNEAFRGQGVKLGVGDALGSYHAITFLGWNSSKQSWIADSDADYLTGDRTSWNNYTDSNGIWHITLSDGSSVLKDYSVWNIVTACPVPETSTMLLLGIGLISLAGTARRKLKK